MMFPNISFNPSKANNDAKQNLLHNNASNYQGSMNYLNQQIQMNASFLNPLYFLQQQRSGNKRDVTSSCSSTSSSSSCSSTSSTNHQATNDLKPLFPPIFNNLYQSTANLAAGTFDNNPYKGLNPTLAMANDYLNSYLLNYNNQQAQTVESNMNLNVHYDKKSSKTVSTNKIPELTKIVNFTMTRFVNIDSLPFLITSYTFQSNALSKIFFIFPVIYKQFFIKLRTQKLN